MTRLLLLAATALGSLTACVPAAGEFPSLAMRPGEREISTESPPRPPVAVQSDPALLQRVAEFRRLAAEGDRAFEAAHGSAAAAVAAAGAEGTDSWVEAQQAVSGLETTRETTSLALAELDQLAIGRVNLPTNEGDFAAVNQAIDAVEAILADQQQRMDALTARLQR